ncbi:anti-sigma factor domain-containing protein [Demequina mangrovi]|uniref:DNA-directed RNA polymerase specialized sigma subunit, sigma24 family n=1 Tax=Demequina mangrovi TaxID=1043493 RepID=A0A1H6WJ91_9MICO|nr:anti-sigma factor [Demequina mangrovi]SEJ12870.1 DNA-directed RNA polymerase specialized sigma subunit, sigma24 family [Demequina mangrovi]
MCEPEVEDAYRESGALVHALALRSLGSVEEAEDIVRRVFASAAAGGSLESRDLLHDAADRITGDLERRVRARLTTLDEMPLGADGVTDASEVLAEADRILVAAALDRVDAAERAALERAIVDGVPRFELARDLGMSEEDLEERLRDALVAIWPGQAPPEGHASLDGLAARALGIRVADGGRAHIAECRECRDAWRSLNNLVGTIARTGTQAPTVAPRESLWEEVREAVDAVDAGAPAPESDWRTEARAQATAAQRRRTMLMGVAVVAASVFVALAVLVAQLAADGEGAAIASAVLEDPRSGAGDVGQASIHVDADGTEVVVVEGVYAEYPDAYLELWLRTGDGEPVSLGQISTARYSVALPPEIASARGATLEVSREPWDGDAAQTGDVIARGTFG